VFVSFKNGLFVETEDKAYSFKVGGRIILDGGGIIALNGFVTRSAAGSFASRSRQGGGHLLLVQYDFAGTAQVTGNNQVLSGIRDAYFGIQSPLFTLPFAKEPAYVMVGSMFEPFSVEAINSSKFRDFIERSLAVDTFQPDRHIGLAMGAYGDDWTFKAASSAPALAMQPETPRVVIRRPGAFATLYSQRGRRAIIPINTTWFQATGGGQYFDVTAA
jgi:phosphate-selective porin OprO/OprP